MKKTVQEQRQERGRLVKQMRDLTDKAEAEKRELTTDEQSTWDKLDKDQERIGETLKREDRQVELEREMAAAAGPDSERSEDGDEGETRGALDAAKVSAERRKRFGNYLARGLSGLPAAEQRALAADIDIQGGFLTAPIEFVNDLVKAVDNLVFVRQYATIKPVASAQSLGVPSLDADPADADWTGEILTGSEDSSMAFGKRELHPHPLAKRIKVSNKLMRLAMMGPEELVRTRLGYKFAVSMEKAYLTGTGASQPLGVFTANTNGISTGRDVSTSNSTTAIAADNLFEVMYSLKAPYQAKAIWGFHRDAVKQIRKLKDSQNRYLWEPDMRAGQPDTILSRPFFMSEYIPNTFTTGLYVGILGDFSYYWIADSVQLGIQRLTELYAETNQTGFIGRLESDGMPVLEEAFARVKLA